MIDKTVCVFDHGLFVELALRLSRDFKRVLYHVPWERGFSTVNDAVIGDGFDEIERVDSIWDHINEVDLFIFPDIQHSGLQLHLEDMGKPVWGSRKADGLELGRVRFLEMLKEQGLPVPGYRVVRGLSELRNVLKDESNKYIKISKFRGSMETWHHVNYALSEPMLDSIALRLGSVQNQIYFVVCDPIDTDLEVGYDGYCIDGAFPSLSIQGYEIKDSAYIASVQKYENLPEEIKVVNNSISPVLRRFRYRNFLSTEIRVREGKSFFIDPCCRCPSPATEAQLELYSNLGEIILRGAVGELVDFEPVGKFAVEASICHKGKVDCWRTVDIPDSVRRWVKLYNVCKLDGLYHIPPVEPHEIEIGWAIGVGDTIQESIDRLKDIVDKIKDQNIIVKMESIADALSVVKSAEENGVEFTSQQVPEPGTAVVE